MKTRTMETVIVGELSPWGVIETATVHALGIVEVSTASHGGIVLNEEKWAELMEVFPDFKPFCRQPGWLEEDCDGLLAVVLWPDAFNWKRVAWAICDLSRGSGYPTPALTAVSEWLRGGSPRALELTKRAAQWMADNGGLWRRMENRPTGGRWVSVWMQFETGETREIVSAIESPHYGASGIELDALAIAPPGTVATLADDCAAQILELARRMEAKGFPGMARHLRTFGNEAEWAHLETLCRLGIQRAKQN